MYAAAGGASIASRRKQKRLHLNKQQASAQSAAAAAVRNRITGGINDTTATTHATKFSRSHVPILHPTHPSLPLNQPASSSTTTCAFHSSHEHHRHRRRFRHHHHYHHHHHHHHHHRQQPDKIVSNFLAPPISPIQFPISPPPLSLESPNSLTHPFKSSNFPFPPPSFLDLRVSPSTSELQCGSQTSGKAAWQGCSRPSPLPLSPASPLGSRGGYKTKQCEAHRRWMKRNRIRDASYCYGSSEDDDEGSSSAGRRRPEVNAAVNTVLYAGLGTTALGLVISFVGTGEKGFLSPELRMVGPSLLCAGFLCCLLRILLCLCLCRCCGDCRWKPCRVVIVDKDKMRKSDKSNATTSTGQNTTSLLPESQSNNREMTTTKITTLTKASMPQRTTSLSNNTWPVKGHELLLSPAQLPE
ncbi:hypothetical protein PV328_006405 [Microctonus aethiopoides]|uniref:Uncharacterized protein n=1 Tax=Microctonus aethiopoides TaxID=144406 RepID=A0AA39FP09_9HYME|nr:hypothetical protein PV328_006405 [Microctonus aethiopoides]